MSLVQHPAQDARRIAAALPNLPELDAILAHHLDRATGFADWIACRAEPGAATPAMNRFMMGSDALVLAAAYDSVMAQLGDTRRAAVFGAPVSS